MNYFHVYMHNVNLHTNINEIGSGGFVPVDESSHEPTGVMTFFIEGDWQTISMCIHKMGEKRSNGKLY